MNKIKFYWDIVSPILITLATAIIVFFIVGLVLSIPLCLLWNWLMPHIFGLPAISVLEAFGLSALITMLTPRQIKLNKDNKNINSTDVEKQLEEVFENITSQFKA